MSYLLQLREDFLGSLRFAPVFLMRFPPSHFLLGAAATLTLVVSGLAAPTGVDNDGPKTFSAIVAFGDSFSDNGSSLVYR